MRNSNSKGKSFKFTQEDQERLNSIRANLGVRSEVEALRFALKKVEELQ